MSNVEIVILAAGRGSRMKSKKPKLLNLINGKPIIEHTIINAKKIKNTNINIIINKNLNHLIKKFKGINFIKQKKALGTGDAIKTFLKHTKSLSNILIMMGDAPFINTVDLRRVIKKLKNYPIVVLGAKLKKNYGNGIIILKKNLIKEIKEFKLLKKEEHYNKYCNTGVFGVQKKYLKLFFNLKKDKIIKEYLVTDILKIAYKKKIHSKLVKTKNINSFGINTLAELKMIKKI